jgi:hypothetical protein
MASSAVLSLPAIRDLNHRGIELMAQAARRSRDSPLSLIGTLQRELRESTPATRARAADRPFLLLDLEFSNAAWWQTVVRDPNRRIRRESLQPAFPRSSALPLTRATLTAIWRSVSTDARSARILLGLDEAVTHLFIDLPVTAIDPIANHIHSHLKPRWADHPPYWRRLFRAATTEDGTELAQIDIQGLQLLTSEFLIARTQQNTRPAVENRKIRLPTIRSGAAEVSTGDSSITAAGTRL